MRLDYLCKQRGLCPTPAFLPEVGNLGVCPAEGAYVSSPQSKPWAPGLQKAPLVDNISMLQLATGGNEASPVRRHWERRLRPSALSPC